jgi:hypothetical protein
MPKEQSFLAALEDMRNKTEKVSYLTSTFNRYVIIFSVKTFSNVDNLLKFYCELCHFNALE